MIRKKISPFVKYSLTMVLVTTFLLSSRHIFSKLYQRAEFFGKLNGIPHQELYELSLKYWGYAMIPFYVLLLVIIFLSVHYYWKYSSKEGIFLQSLSFPIIFSILATVFLLFLPTTFDEPLGVLFLYPILYYLPTLVFILIINGFLLWYRHKKRK